MFSLDELGSLQPINTFVVHGYGVYVLLSFLDRANSQRRISELGLVDAQKLLQGCWNVIEEMTVLGKNSVETVLVNEEGAQKLSSS
jgi:hypothetical protein